MINEKEIFYEIHITVKNADVEKFKIACKEAKVKPILLDLQKEGLFDLMTSSVVKQTENSAETMKTVFNECKIVSALLKIHGFEVIRTKIETVPWNPTISNYSNGYYETHLAVKCPDSMFLALKEITGLSFAHMSKNVFKKIDDVPVYMITYRTYSGNLKLHENYVTVITKALGEFEITKTITEYCIFDSNVDHDNEWME